jgi:hypothetical protein
MIFSHFFLICFCINKLFFHIGLFDLKHPQSRIVQGLIALFEPWKGWELDPARQLFLRFSVLKQSHLQSAGLMQKT